MKNDHGVSPGKTRQASTLEDNQFNLVIGDGSLVHSERIPEMFEEMVRASQRQDAHGRARRCRLLQLRRVLFDLLGGVAQPGAA